MSRKEKILIVEPAAIVTEGLTRILKELTEFEILPPSRRYGRFQRTSGCGST